MVWITGYQNKSIHHKRKTVTRIVLESYFLNFFPRNILNLKYKKKGVRNTLPPLRSKYHQQIEFNLRASFKMKLIDPLKVITQFAITI